MFSVFNQTFSYWRRDRVSILAAALAYHMLFAIAPIILVILTIVGVFYSQDSVQDSVLTQLEAYFNPVVATSIASILENLYESRDAGFKGLISVVLVLLAASGLITFLSKALNQIWYVEVLPASIFNRVWIRIRNMVLLILLGLFWFTSILIGRLVPILENFTDINSLYEFYNEFFGIVVATVIYTLLVKVLVEKPTPTFPVFVGSFFTAVIMYLGGLVLNIYLSNFPPTTAFGTAGSIVLFLLWMYYSAFIYFFGMELTKTLSLEE